MSEQTNIKVYELSKELGIDSISLLDKLKALDIHVKSHMSSLTAEQAAAARTALMEKKKAGSKTARKKTDSSATKKKAATAKTTVKKKAASNGVAGAAATAAPAPSAAAQARTVIRKRSAGGATTVTVTKDDPGEGKTQQATVVRRRATAEGEAQRVSVNPTELVRAAEADAATADVATEERLEEAHYGEAAETQEAQSHVQTADDSDGEAQLTVAPDVSPEGDEARGTAAPVEDAETTSAKAAPPAGKPEPPRRTSFLKETKITPPKSKIISIASPTAPTPTKIIRPASSASAGGVRGTTERDSQGNKIIKVSKENLQRMVEEESARAKKGGATDKPVRPEDVRFADYRKKEVIFLPKKKRIPTGKDIKRTEITTPAAHKRVVEMEEVISVQELANRMSVKAPQVMKKLIGMGQMVAINQAIDFDTASLVAGEFGFDVKNVAFREEALIPTAQTEDKPEDLKPRPPIVTVMGHVDHGKTSLLDCIRSANVADREHGGITQHIGAYTIEKDGKQITFIDTPGHEAFSLMRARGANVTDIVILVVAADDGVMPQTREALSHAKAAGVPIVVAVNKIDKPGANPEKIKQGLAELDLLAEDWGGETMFVHVSAKEATNIDKLLEAVLLNAEMLDLRANPEKNAEGTVLEGRLEKGRGPVVSVLVKRGTLKKGDPIVATKFAGKVRALMDHNRKPIDECGPGMAAEVLGFEGVPNAGDPFHSTATEADARKIAQHRIDRDREEAHAPSAKMSLEELFSKVQSGDTKELKIVLKADVFGSVEAVKDSLIKCSTEKVKVNVILSNTGGITESDVLLASASDAIIIGFNVRPDTKAMRIGADQSVEIKTYNIIYELIDDVKKGMAGLLEKKKVEKYLGRAEVRQTFTVPKIGMIAGTHVIDGKVLRGANVRLLRDNIVVYEGKMSSLKRFKDDAKEVAQGYECGIGLENYNDVKPGDVIEAYEIELVAQEL